ncbi:MAG: cytochrome c biogenesis CcdA family protein [bacterium]
MDVSLTNVLLVMLAGITSVASPCVLPVIPIIVTGTVEEHRYRPLLIVLGLSFSFILMGVVSASFGSLITGKMLIIEKAAGVIIMLFGLLMFFNVNLFKHITIFNRLQSRSSGPWSGLFLGVTLGVIWIPCIGPILSGVLALVASEGKVAQGTSLLVFYSLGFSIPILIAGYGSQIFRQRIAGLMIHQRLIRYVSGSILIIFGIYIFKQGLLGFGF